MPSGPLPALKAQFAKEQLGPRGLASYDSGWKAVIAHRKSQVVLIEHSEGLGTGLLISADGLIITNKHVVQGAAGVRIGFANKTSTWGTVIHVHHSSDLAIVKGALHDVEFFDVKAETNESIEAGDEIIAIGHPHGLRFTSTRGIVSVARQRFGTDYFLQHDVSINPGNSGGPLIDRTGRLVGINTFIHRDSQGLGFAIPSPVISAYVGAVTEEIAVGQLKLPPDDEILEAEGRITPEKALYAAIVTFGGKHELVDGGHLVHASSGNSLIVFISDHTIVCTSKQSIEDLWIREAAFLRMLLEFNWVDSDQARVALTSDSVHVLASRPTEGLDAMEAYSLIASVDRAASKLNHSIGNYCADILQRFRDSEEYKSLFGDED